MTTFRRTTIAAFMASAVSGFSVIPSQTVQSSSSTTQLQMGLFDGVKQAFSAPALERSTVNSERETPIDRWMGWSVDSEEDKKKAEQKASPKDFVDSMDKANYVTVELEKPMGIVFEENDEEFGGIFVQSLKEGGVAAADGALQAGDQLVAVGSQKVAGLPFDDALGTIVDSTSPKTKLVLFRGKAEQFYGPTGASKAWLDEFIASSSGSNEVTEEVSGEVDAPAEASS